jgi:hypothetical protein
LDDLLGMDVLVKDFTVVRKEDLPIRKLSFDDFLEYLTEFYEVEMSSPGGASCAVRISR